MYTIVNPIEKLISNAEKFVIENDRVIYEPILLLVEEYCSANKYIIHSRSMLFGAPISRDDYVYTVIMDGGFDSVCKFADYIFAAKCPHVPMNTLSLTTSIKNRSYSIGVNSRPIVNIIHVANLSDIRDKISTHVNGRFNKANTLLATNSMIHLLNNYEIMYSYANHKKWSAEIEVERQLFALMNDTAEITGAGFIPINDLVKDVFSNIAKYDAIIIGDFAYSTLGYTDSAKNDRLQFISTLEIEDIIATTKKIVGPKYEVLSVKSTFVFDSRLTKYTIKVKSGDTKYDLFDVFNNAQYDALSYCEATYQQNKMPIKCASPYVLMRYALIQYYITHVILGANSSKRFNDYTMVRDKVQAVLARNSVEEIESNLFNKERLFGANILEKIWNRQFMTERHPIYYPAIASKERAKNGGSNGLLVNNPFEPRLGGEVSWNNTTHLKIVQKITNDYRRDIPKILDAYYGANSSMWASQAPKNPARFDKVLKYVKNVDMYVDIGSGDGIDFVFLAEKMNAKHAISCDVKNYLRVDLSANKEHMLIEPNNALAIKDASADVITMLHSLHHCIDAKFRLNDIARILKPCGVLIIKDHDIIGADDANNVSLEHFVYSIGEKTATIDDVARYQEIEPMYYFSHNDVKQYIIGLGFTEKVFLPYNTATKVYYSVFQKYDKKGADCLYKGEADMVGSNGI
jgi:SAM-dependent methyltransferase